MLRPPSPIPGAALARAGFSLVEILAVLLIVGVLFAFVLPNLMSSQEAVRAQSARAWLSQLTAEFESFENDRGDYPPSTFPEKLDPKPTRTNMGIESVVIALLPADGSYRASGDFDDKLCNTDGDDTKTRHTVFQSSEAFELMDEWDNPIAYLHRRDYEKGCVYLTYSEEAAGFVETKVTAMINPTTGSPYRSTSFQLISAGPDGEFGTDDDIANFDRN